MADQSELRNNHLLATLASHAANLRLHLTSVHLAPGQVLVSPGEPQQDVYFPINCLISVLVELAGGRAVELSLVGREGFVGVRVLLDAGPGPHRVICQIAGDALRMSVTSFRSALGRRSVPRALLYRYAGVMLDETTQLAACTVSHPLAQRLARCLLMINDRVGADEFYLTQGFLASMLAVRRPYLNATVQQLQRDGCIGYRNG